MQITSYVALIKWLIALGPIFTEVWPLVLQLFGLIQQIAERIGAAIPKTEGGLNEELPLTEEEAAAEKELAEVYAAAYSLSDDRQAAFDFGIVRRIFQLANVSPVIKALIETGLAAIGEARAKKAA